MVHRMKVRDLAAARAGDKGSTLDITLVAFDDDGYATLRDALTLDVVTRWLHRAVAGPVVRHELPALRALKFVAPEALAGGLYASVRAGLHWQKAAIWLVLDEEVPT
jgi:hypothetical protein